VGVCRASRTETIAQIDIAAVQQEIEELEADLSEVRVTMVEYLK